MKNYNLFINESKLDMIFVKKIKYQSYPGYQYQYKNLDFIIWNGSSTKNSDWYINFLNDNNNNLFTEKELDKNYKSKKQMIEYAKYLIDKLPIK